MIRFVVISEARSGSTMLGSALGSHPQVAMHGELFGHHKFPLNFYGIDERLPWPTPLELVLKRVRDANHERFLKDYVFADTARSAVGFKFKFEEFSVWPQVVDFIHDEQLKILFLKRLDREARFNSEITAERAGSFNSTDAVRFGRREITDKDVQRGIEISLEREQAFKKRFDTYAFLLELTYESLVESWSETMRSVYSFLEIDELMLLPETRKLDR